MRKRILFVDNDLNPKRKTAKDAKAILDEMVCALKESHHVTVAYSLNSASEKSSSMEFDFAVVDIFIPVDDDDVDSEGDEQFGRQLIKELNGKKIPVVGISNLADLHSVSRIIQDLKIITALNKKREYIPTLLDIINNYQKFVSKLRDRHCVFIDNKRCQRQFHANDSKSVFIISSDKMKDTLTQLKSKLERDGFAVEKWDENKDDSAGNIFHNKTCPKIYSNRILVAETSDLNCNVFFEIGFAMGLGRLVLMCHKENAGTEEKKFRIVRTIYQKKYQTPADIHASVNSTVAKNKDHLNSLAVYDKSNIFDTIQDFDAPEKRSKSRKYIVSFSGRLVQECSKLLEDEGIDLSSVTILKLPEDERNLYNLVEKLVNAERILFFPQGDLEKATGHYRINNAELILLAGLCVAQGIGVKIVTDSRSPDFSEISVSMTEKLADFMN